MRDGRLLLGGIVKGAVLPAAAFAVTSYVMKTPEILLYYVNAVFPLAVWYVAITLGITLAASKTGRLWPGAVVGAWSYLLFHVWTGLMQPPAERVAALLSPGSMLGTLGSVGMPFVFGMMLGWASVHRRPVRHDGAGSAG